MSLLPQTTIILISVYSGGDVAGKHYSKQTQVFNFLTNNNMIFSQYFLSFFFFLHYFLSFPCLASQSLLSFLQCKHSVNLLWVIGK